MADFTGSSAHFTSLSADSLTVPPNTILDANVKDAAAIQATKIIGRQRHVYTEGEYNDVPTSLRKILTVITGTTGTLRTFKAGSKTAASTGTCTVDLLVNGSSVLSAAIILSSSHTSGQMVAATIQTAGVAIDAIIEVQTTVAGGWDGQGLVAIMTSDEAPL